MEILTIQLRQRGTLTLPAKLRSRYKLEEGDVLTVIDLDGILFLSPRVPMVPKLVAEIERLRQEAGLTPEDLLEGLIDQDLAPGRVVVPTPPATHGSHSLREISCFS